MSKKSPAAMDRRARVEQMQQQQARGERRRRLLLIGVTAAVLLVIIGGISWTVVNQRESGQIEGLQSYDDLARDHVQDKLPPTTLPPTGGKHAGVWQNCGVYSAPIPTENALHSMEHGAVWITYRPDLATDQVSRLAADAKGKSHVLVSPYPELAAPVVASAWGKQVELSGADDRRLTQFIKDFQNGPQTPEPGASCTGGDGTPTGA